MENNEQYLAMKGSLRSFIHTLKRMRHDSSVSVNHFNFIPPFSKVSQYNMTLNMLFILCNKSVDML